MTHTDPAWTFGGGAGSWIFRVLLVAAAAFMAYTFFQPWWGADVAVIPGEDDLLLHPWGIETVAQVRAGADPSLYSMPGFFAPFVWVYFAVAMLALLASLFWTKRVRLGPISLPLAAVVILVVGLSYLITVGLAYYIGDMRAAGMDMKFIGRSNFTDPSSHRKVQMVSDLRPGYWLALYAGIALTVLGLIRFVSVRRSRAPAAI
jgi:hypothetical protein